MKSNEKAFFLLLAVSLSAVVLAVFVHERNVRDFERALPGLVPAPSVLVPEAPSSSDPVVEAPQPVVEPHPALPPIPIVVFSSRDDVTEAVLEGYPSLGRTFTFYGTSTAFENQIVWRVRDAERTVLGEGPIYVHSPDAGIPGPFRETVMLEKQPATASGTLFIFEPSARDGTPIHIVTIPVTFSTSTTL